MKNIISKKQAASNPGEGIHYFERRDIDNYPTIQLMGTLEADETIPVMYLGSDDTTLTQAYDDDGVALAFSSTVTAIPIKRSLRIKVVKEITTNAVGVDIVGVY